MGKIRVIRRNERTADIKPRLTHQGKWTPQGRMVARSPLGSIISSSRCHDKQLRWDLKESLPCLSSRSPTRCGTLACVAASLVTHLCPASQRDSKYLESRGRVEK